MHINWFISYHAVNGSSVFMGNNVSCQTVGVGNGRIKMYDDIIITLLNVRHVPELRKNLISLGVLDLEVYRSRWNVESFKGRFGCYEGREDQKPLQTQRKYSGQ